MRFLAALGLALAANAGNAADSTTIFGPPVVPIGKDASPPAAHAFDWSGQYLTRPYGAVRASSPGDACCATARPANPDYCLRTVDGAYGCKPDDRSQPFAASLAPPTDSGTAGG